MYERGVVTHDRGVSRAPWSPAQIVSLLLGLLYFALGGVTLARTGLSFDNLFAHAEVGGLHSSMLMGIIMVLFAMGWLLAGAMPGADRFGMVFLGVIALGFGLIVAIESAAFHRTLGLHEGNGWLFLITGTISLIAAMVAPVIWSSSRGDRVVASETHVEQPAQRVIIDE